MSGIGWYSTVENLKGLSQLPIAHTDTHTQTILNGGGVQLARGWRRGGEPGAGVRT